MVVVQVEEVGIVDDDFLRGFGGGLTARVRGTQTGELFLLEPDLATLTPAEIQFNSLISILHPISLNIKVDSEILLRVFIKIELPGLILPFPNQLSLLISHFQRSFFLNFRTRLLYFQDLISDATQRKVRSNPLKIHPHSNPNHPSHILPTSLIKR